MNNIILTVTTFTVIYLPCYLYIRRIKRHDQRQSTATPYTLPPVKPAAKPPAKKTSKRDPETISALYAQADTELAYADALDQKARAESDPVKRAAFFKRAATSRTKAQQLSFKAYTLESPD